MRRLPATAMVIMLAAAGLAAVAWQGLRALDWSHLEPRIQEALGREISLDGPIRFELLPRPELTIGGVSAIDVKVREATAVLNAGALLTGSLEIDTLVFSGVELTLNRSLMRPLPGLPARRIRMEDSIIAFGDAVVPVQTATLTARRPEGPYRLEARASFDEEDYRIVASVGRWRNHMPVAVSLDGSGFEAVTVGAIAADASGDFRFSGRLAARGEVRPGWRGTFDAEMLLGLDGARFTGVDMVLADQRFTGAMQADWRGGAAIDARLSTSLLPFDDWRSRLSQLAGAAPGASLRLALNAGAVTFGDRTARRVEAVFRREADGVRMERLAAALPGGTRVALAGEGHENAAFSLKTKNLRALLLWLGIDPGAVEESRLRDFEAEGRLHLAGSGVAPQTLRSRFERGDFALEEVRGHLDGAQIEARLVRRAGRFDAGLTARDLPLDPFRPVLESARHSGALQLDLSRTRLLGVSVGRLTVAGERGEDGEVVISRLAVEDAGGLSGEASGRLDDETAAFRIAARTTDLDRSATLYGLALPSALRGLGAVEVEGRGEGPADRLPMEVRATAGDRMLRLAGALAERAIFRGRVELEGSLPPGWRLSDEDGPAKLAASVSAGRDRADFTDMDFRLGAMRVRGHGSLGLDGERPAVRLALAAGRVDLPALSLEVPVWRRRPLDLSPFGAFDLDLELGIGALGIGGEALEDLQMRLSLSPEAWVVHAARTGWRGGRIALDGGYRGKDGRARLKLALRDALLPVRAGFGPSGARSRVLLDLAAEGRSPHGLVSTLSGTALMELSGGRLNGMEAAAARQALDKAPDAAALLRRLRMALVSGGSRLVSGRLAASIEHGVARPVGGGFRLADGQVAVSGSVDLRRRLIDLAGRLAFPDRPELPPLGFSLAGPLDDPDRLPEVESVEALLLSEGVAGLVRPNAN